MAPTIRRPALLASFTFSRLTSLIILSNFAVSLAVFAYTTLLGWAYYGEKCWAYLLGTVTEKPFRILWTLAVFPGAVLSLDFAWLVADTLNALMAIPNLIVLLLLSPQIVALTREYFSDDPEDQGSPAPVVQPEGD